VTTEHENDPAFPSEPRTNPEAFEPGMNLLEWYVAHALDGSALARDGHGNLIQITTLEIDILTDNALRIAKAAARKARP